MAGRRWSEATPFFERLSGHDECKINIAKHPTRRTGQILDRPALIPANRGFLDPAAIGGANRPDGRARIYFRGFRGALTGEERAFLRAEAPWGFILFKRNIETPAKSLRCSRFAQCLGPRRCARPDRPGGGRVQRLGPPHWPAYPGRGVRRALGHRPRLRPRGGAARRPADRGRPRDLASRWTACRWRTCGGGRRRGDRRPRLRHAHDKVAAIARAGPPARAGRRAAGAQAHPRPRPGHRGQPPPPATVDVPAAELERTDFAAFAPLADLPMAMTAHVVFSALDPAQPATTSATIIAEVIRGTIGFQGLLMSDDVSMNALQGSIAARTRASLSAGCDVVLHCNGKLDEMREVATEAPPLAARPWRGRSARLPRARRRSVRPRGRPRRLRAPDRPRREPHS